MGNENLISHILFALYASLIDYTWDMKRINEYLSLRKCKNLK